MDNRFVDEIVVSEKLGKRVSSYRDSHLRIFPAKRSCDV
jgi:hypothetical protein